MRALQSERDRASREQRYLEALLDDMPVAVLTIDAERGVTPANKAARRLFGQHVGTRQSDYAIYGATFARWLGVPDADMATIFPGIGNFATPRLGLLG